jgi:hypothetical protein
VAPTLRQTAGSAVGSGQSRTCTANFTAPSLPGSLLVVTAVSMGGTAALAVSSGFQLIRERVFGDIKLSMWYMEGAPETSSATVTTSVDRSLQVRIMEYQGAAMSGALDQVTIATSQTALASTGTTGTTSQADSIVVACVANQYVSTLQSGFSGALTRLIEQVTPQSGWGWYGLSSDPDYLRTRLTIHQTITSAVQQFVLQAYLTAVAPWIAILCTFKGGSSGPVRMTSRGRSAITIGGRGDLTVFGPLRSTAAVLASQAVALNISGGIARMGPFTHQYRLGGWDGLLIGQDTDYRVESVEGLGGWEMRTSDDELPRGDGGLRGVDLQSARQIVFKVNANSPFKPDSAEAQADVEDKLNILYRALVPQRNQDWELLWRDPDTPLKMLRCRPVNIIRQLDWQQILLLDQTFALKATDPRHYSAFAKSIRVPRHPSWSRLPYILLTLNEGNGFAYPTDPRAVRPRRCSASSCATRPTTSRGPSRASSRPERRWSATWKRTPTSGPPVRSSRSTASPSTACGASPARRSAWPRAPTTSPWPPCRPEPPPW